MTIRIAPAEPPYPPSVQERLDRLMPPGVPPLVLFRVMARDERLFLRFVGGGLLDRGQLTIREREIVILRVCASHGSRYEWGVHVSAFAAKAGLTEAQVNATVTRAVDDPGWQPRERLLLRLCDELHASTRVSDELWRALRAELSEEALLELLLLISYYRTVSVLTNSLCLPLEPWAAAFPEVPGAADPVEP